MEFPPHLPPVLYVPTTAATDVPDDVQVEYRITKDGRKALLAYSAMDRLTDAMGPYQPWLVCTTAQLEGLWQVDRFDVFYLDIAVPVTHQRKLESE